MTVTKINESLPTISVVLWKWTTNNEGKHPVKIRLWHGKYHYYHAEHEGEKISMSQDDWKKITIIEKDKNGNEWVKGFRKDLRGKNRVILDAIESCLSEARKAQKLAVANGKLFTVSNFEKHFLNKDIDQGFIAKFDEYIQGLLDKGRTGSYIAYKNAMDAFKAFRNDKELSPADITVQLLEDFESWLKKRKTSKHPNTGKEIIRQAGPTTIAMYMRVVKAIYNNIAIDHPELLQDYPFARKQNERSKYHIPASSGDHKGQALSKSTLEAFINTKTDPGTIMHESKYYFLFSLIAQGMNMRDIANLKFKDIKPDVIRYVREKTKLTTRGNKKIVIEVPRIESLNQILLDLSSTDKDPDNFVFDILNSRMTPIEQDKAIRQKIKIVNKWIKFICKANDIETFTTYSARHSYANLLKQAGESTDFISETLGHSDLKTTSENYLRAFDLEKKKKVNESIFNGLMKKSA